MSIPSKTKESLSRKELISRLEEAEETLRAIRSGEKDALVVSGEQGEQIFTLKDATVPYRTLIEEMNESALTLTLDGVILYCNSHFAKTLGVSKEEIMGNSFFRLVVPSDRDKAKAFLEQSVMSENRAELALLGSKAIIPVGISLKGMELDGDLCFGMVISNLTERKQAENEIRSLNASLEQRVAERTQQLDFERARWRGIVEGIAEEVWWCTAQGNLSLLNLGKATGMGLDAVRHGSIEEIYQQVDFLNPDGQLRPLEQSPLMRSLQGEIVRGEEITRNRRTGATRYRQFSSAPTSDSNGTITGAVAIIRDVTEQKQVAEQLAAALKEKEVLLKEIHHRVKNNLQVISSILHLQSTAIGDPQLREFLEDSQRRVRAMAFIHEQLYQSPNLNRINFKDYLYNLIKYLRRSYTILISEMEINVTAEDMLIEMDQAVPLGLLVSELVSNSLKHAFPSGFSTQARNVQIAVRRDPSDGLIVSVADNGVGLPDNLDIEQTSSMGLQLVRSFADQLHAKISVQREPGTTFTVVIPERKVDDH